MWGWLRIDNLGPRVRNCVPGTRSRQCNGQVLCFSSPLDWISFRTALFFSLNYSVCLSLEPVKGSVTAGTGVWSLSLRGRWGEPQRYQVKAAHKPNVHIPGLWGCPKFIVSGMILIKGVCGGDVPLCCTQPPEHTRLFHCDQFIYKKLNYQLKGLYTS